MSEQDRIYFERRAEIELKLAKQSLDPAVMRTHYALARRYLDNALRTRQHNEPA